MCGEEGGRRCDGLGREVSEDGPQLVGCGSAFYDIEGELEGRVLWVCGWVRGGKRGAEEGERVVGWG